MQETRVDCRRNLRDRNVLEVLGGRTRRKTREQQGGSPRWTYIWAVRAATVLGKRPTVMLSLPQGSCAIQMACKTGRFQRRKPMDRVPA